MSKPKRQTKLGHLRALVAGWLDAMTVTCPECDGSGGRCVAEWSPAFTGRNGRVYSGGVGLVRYRCEFCDGDGGVPYRRAHP